MSRWLFRQDQDINESISYVSELAVSETTAIHIKSVYTYTS